MEALSRSERMMGKSCDPLNKRLTQATSGRGTPVIFLKSTVKTGELQYNHYNSQWKSQRTIRYTAGLARASYRYYTGGGSESTLLTQGRGGLMNPVIRWLSCY